MPWLLFSGRSTINNQLDLSIPILVNFFFFLSKLAKLGRLLPPIVSKPSLMVEEMDFQTFPEVDRKNTLLVSPASIGRSPVMKKIRLEYQCTVLMCFEKMSGIIMHNSQIKDKPKPLTCNHSVFLSCLAKWRSDLSLFRFIFKQTNCDKQNLEVSTLNTTCNHKQKLWKSMTSFHLFLLFSQSKKNKRKTPGSTNPKYLPCCYPEKHSWAHCVYFARLK